MFGSQIDGQRRENDMWMVFDKAHGPILSGSSPE